MENSYREKHRKEREKNIGRNGEFCLVLNHCYLVPARHTPGVSFSLVSHREPKEPYLGLLWEASRSKGSLPHPLLMGPKHLDLLQVPTK